MPYHLHIEIPGLPRTLNPSGRPTNRWVLKREREMWVQRIWAEVVSKGRPPIPLTLARIRCTRLSAVRPDYDNLVGSFKPCLDALIKISVLVDDKFENIGNPEYVWSRGQRGAGRIRIEVWER